MRQRNRLTYQYLEPRCLLATLFTENFESFAGAGFASTVTAGQLDSDLWRVTGLSDGSGTFGGTHATGDFARGLSNSPVTTGGVYAFDVGGNRVLGGQATGSDLAPGAFELRLTNTSGAAVTDWTISYDIWFNNDQSRSSSLKLSYSTDGVNFAAVSSLDFTTPEIADGNGWSSNANQSVVNASVAEGGLLFFRWSIADAGGAGSRDELGFDQVIVSSGTGGNEVGGVKTQDLRIVNYNIANSPQSSGNDAPFRTVFSAIGLDTRAGVTREIDLLVIQETDPTSLARIEGILDGLYIQNYARVISNNFSGDYFGYVYNTSTLTLLETENISGNFTRDPFRALFRPVGAPSGNADFQVINVHLNATDAATRETEAIGIRARLDSFASSANLIVAGDLNIDASSETSYSILTGSGNGQVLDPLGAPGNWRGNAAFKSIHTQNPAVQMDDRFDFQLINDDVFAAGGLEYIPTSYRAFGNNGTHTLNQAITTGTGASSTILTALATATDHLPVVVDYRYQVAAIDTAAIFYNNSSFDVTNDLSAMAGKFPLLPHQTATFANYSSYVKGINGFVMEVNGLGAVPTLSNLNQFFQFRRGNNDDVQTWTSAASPNQVVYQSNINANGTDRIFLTWPDQSIRNTWLEVTALSNATTGLVASVKFYFGNAVGETGNDSSNAIVNLSDVGLTRQNQTGFGNATIENPYDFDRDGRVNLADIGIVRNHQSGFSPLALITPGGLGRSNHGTPRGLSRGDHLSDRLPAVLGLLPDEVGFSSSGNSAQRGKEPSRIDLSIRDRAFAELELAGSTFMLPRQNPLEKINPDLVLLTRSSTKKFQVGGTALPKNLGDSLSKDLSPLEIESESIACKWLQLL